MIGQIYKIYTDLYYVKSDDIIYKCKIREIIKKQKISVVTGDMVEFTDNIIHKVLPRRNFIKRPTVANVDQIVIVSALKQPKLDFLQLNRYIALAKFYKIPAILCFNKEDLGLENNLVDKIISIYEPLNYKIVFTSALQKKGLDKLEELLEHKTSALCGNSGVGKSSLINAIHPCINLKTQSVSEKLNRGTHTTRHCEIISLNQDTGIIDTPGFSNVKFDFILPKDVSLLFDEILEYKDLCKFKDCLHINEVGCEVLKHLENIPQERYESYTAFVQEAFDYKQKVKYNGLKEETTQKYQYNRTVAKISEKKRKVSRNTEKQKIYKEYHNDDNE